MGAGDGLTPWPQDLHSFVDWVNGLLGKLMRQRIRGYGLNVHRGSEGQALALSEAKPFWGRLQGAANTGANPYTVACEVRFDPAIETWVNVPSTGGQTAIELNSRSGCGNRIEWLMPGIAGDYRFYDPLVPPCQLNVQWFDCVGSGPQGVPPPSAFGAGAYVTVWNDDDTVFATCSTQTVPPYTTSFEIDSGAHQDSNQPEICIFKNVPPGNYYVTITEPNYNNFMLQLGVNNYVPQTNRFSISPTDSVKTVTYGASMLPDFVCCSGSTLGPATTSTPAMAIKNNYCGPVKKHLQLSDLNGTYPLTSVINPTHVISGITFRDLFQGVWSTSYTLSQPGAIYTNSYGYSSGTCYPQYSVDGAVGYLLLCPSQLPGYYAGPPYARPSQWKLFMYWGRCLVLHYNIIGQQTVVSANPWSSATSIPDGKIWDGTSNGDVYPPASAGFPIQVGKIDGNYAIATIQAAPINAVSPCYPLALTFTFTDFSYPDVGGVTRTFAPPGGYTVTVIQAP